MEPPSRDHHTQTDDNEFEPEFTNYGDGECRRDSDGHPIYSRMHKHIVNRIRRKASNEIDKNGVEYIPSSNKNTKGTLTIQGRPTTFKYVRNYIVIPHLDDDVKDYGYTAVAAAIGKELRDPIYGKRGKRARKKRKEEEEKKKEIEEAERKAAVTVRRAEAAVALANHRLRETEQKRKEAEDDAWAARKKRLEGERKWKESVEKATKARNVAEAKFDSEMQLTFQAILNGSSSVPTECPPIMKIVTIPLAKLTGDELFEIRTVLRTAVRRSGLVGELPDADLTAAMARVTREMELRLDASKRALELQLKRTTLKESSATAQGDGGRERNHRTSHCFGGRGWGNSLFFDPQYRLVGNKRQRIS